jgi:hypothetical protein
VRRCSWYNILLYRSIVGGDISSASSGLSSALFELVGREPGAAPEVAGEMLSCNSMVIKRG